jgi:hypothetical protein
MLQNNTITKLHEMKLSTMVKSFQNQLDDSAAAELGFEDRFSMLIDAEWTARKTIA